MVSFSVFYSLGNVTTNGHVNDLKYLMVLLYLMENYLMVQYYDKTQAMNVKNTKTAHHNNQNCSLGCSCLKMCPNV